MENTLSTRGCENALSRIRQARSAPKPLRRSRRRGEAWREQGLDCLSVSELIKPAARQPATRSFLRLGSLFFADFLWRGKESQRGALPHSATASKETLAGGDSAYSQTILSILVFCSSGHPALKSFIRAGFGTSPSQWENWKNAVGGSAGASTKRGGLKPAYLGLLRCPCHEAFYL